LTRPDAHNYHENHPTVSASTLETSFGKIEVIDGRSMWWLPSPG
jgi:hypothetical protein